MNNTLKERYLHVRERSLKICEPLEKEDFVAQPAPYISPPKWHLGHTTWFYETFILQRFSKDYKIFHEDYPYLFNSYYEAAGKRTARADRGNMTRPTVAEIIQYRQYVDESMVAFLHNMEMSKEPHYLVELGLNHEEQHQELLLTDIKFILGHNPVFPVYGGFIEENPKDPGKNGYLQMAGGLYTIGHQKEGFCFDNELEPHKQWLEDYEISSRLVTKGEFMEFMLEGGYRDFQYWHAEGWEWVTAHGIKAPLYWYEKDGKWHEYGLRGLAPVNHREPLCHISYYEAAAYVEWRGFRLPTEGEWEAAAAEFEWGVRWEWTNSAYLPYPGFKKAAGAVGEYNGKFMVNQMVLRGASVATSPGHQRISYRNFFHPWERWQYTGIRLAR